MTGSIKEAATLILMALIVVLGALALALLYTMLLAFAVVYRWPLEIFALVLAVLVARHVGAL